MDCRLAAVLNTMPCLAPTLTPDMMAAEAASASTQGLLTASTLTARASAKAKLCPSSSQMMSTTQAMPITAGTNTLRTLSARELNGTLAAAVVCTVCTSWAAVESGPMRVARQIRAPLWLAVAA